MTAPIQRLLDKVEWEELPPPDGSDPPGIPIATHQGVLKIGDIEFIVYQLDDGQRVIAEESLKPLLDGASFFR